MGLTSGAIVVLKKDFVCPKCGRQIEHGRLKHGCEVTMQELEKAGIVRLVI